MKAIYFLLLLSTFSGMTLLLVGDDLGVLISNRASLFGRQLIEPDLASLAERAHPDYEQDGANTSLDELFYLRHHPDPQALGALEQILQDNAGRARGHFISAAMALHALDTPESIAILKKALSDPRHYGGTDGRVRQALFSAWGDAGMAKSFINRYLLTTLTDGITVTLKQETGVEDEPNVVRLTYALANTSDRVVGLFDFQPRDAAMAIWLRDAEGRLYPPYRLSRQDDAAPTGTPLEPNDPLIHEIALSLVKSGSKYRAVSSLAFYSLPGPGEYETFVLFERREMNASDFIDVGHHGLSLPDAETWWSGRVVSGPATIRFDEPQTSPGSP
ncbi:MAG: HEAT repeat domain-containing protein [Phycisphaeraceae bacterium]|nr:HEAT repeat domain-containing protein [Phycisphaeraceae bacterium]